MKLSPALAYGALALLAGCHIIGGTDELYIDPELDPVVPDASTGTGGGSGSVNACAEDCTSKTSSTVCKEWACINGSCEEKVKEQPPETCEAGGVCDAGGNCVTCSSDSDCANNPEFGYDECRQPRCSENACDVDFSPMGTSCPNNNVCDGQGSCVECNSAGDCDGGGLCEEGKCITPGCDDSAKNGTETGVDCGGPDCNACDNGQSCVQPSDCKSTLCKDSGGMFICVGCSTQTDCDESKYCELGSSFCKEKKGWTSSCQEDYECKSGACWGLLGCAPG